jgi:hypothetical protein
MIQLDRGQAEGLLSRFDACNDAVLRKIQLHVGSPGGRNRAVVELAARDSESSEARKWVRLELTVFDVKEFRLHEDPQESYYVLSLGLKVGCFGGLYFLDFGPYTDEPEGIEDYRRSRFYIAGSDFKWRVLAYPKTWER